MSNKTPCYRCRHQKCKYDSYIASNDDYVCLKHSTEKDNITGKYILIPCSKVLEKFGDEICPDFETEEVHEKVEREERSKTFFGKLINLFF